MGYRCFLFLSRYSFIPTLPFLSPHSPLPTLVGGVVLLVGFVKYQLSLLNFLLLRSDHLLLTLVSFTDHNNGFRQLHTLVSNPPFSFCDDRSALHLMSFDMVAPSSSKVPIENYKYGEQD